jgi:hypothetical protein
MLTFLRIASIMCQALFGILGTLAPSSRGPQDRLQVAVNNNTKPSLKQSARMAIWGISIATIISLATEGVEVSERRTQAEHERILEQQVSGLHYPITELNVSVDLSFPADPKVRPDIARFLSSQERNRKPYPESDIYHGHPVDKIPYPVDAPADFGEILLYGGIYKVDLQHYKQLRPSSDPKVRPFIATPDMLIEPEGNVAEHGQLLYDTVYKRVIKRVNNMPSGVKKYTANIVGVSDLAGSTLVLLFNAGAGRTANQIAPDERIDCVRLSFPNGPEIDIDGSQINLPLIMLTQSYKTTDQVEFTYEFPTDPNQIRDGACASRGRVALLGPYRGNKSN